MKISDNILAIWSKNHTRGDVSRLTDYTNVSKPTIIKAIKHGHGSEEIILKISQYYSEKIREVEEKALKMFSHGKTQNN